MPLCWAYPIAAGVAESGSPTTISASTGCSRWRVGHPSAAGSGAVACRERSAVGSGEVDQFEAGTSRDVGIEARCETLEPMQRRSRRSRQARPRARISRRWSSVRNFRTQRPTCPANLPRQSGRTPRGSRTASRRSVVRMRDCTLHPFATSPAWILSTMVSPGLSAISRVRTSLSVVVNESFALALRARHAARIALTRLPLCATAIGPELLCGEHRTGVAVDICSSRSSNTGHARSPCAQQECSRSSSVKA